jgi:RNA recognition motif-containing protein
MNIFVAKLNYRTTSEALSDLFSQYGEVTSANVIMDRETGRSKGFAFVEMETEDAGISAIAVLTETIFDGQTSVCKKAEP